MDTQGRRAFLQLVAVLGVTGIVRTGLAGPGSGSDLPGEAVSPATLADSAAILAEARARRQAPLAPGERLDPNTASAEALDRLPGIGPATAEAMVRARDTLPFRSVEDLSRTRGVGPRSVSALAEFVTVVQGPGRRPLPGRTRVPDRTGRRPAPGGKGMVHVNRASLEELQTLPGVGPVLAARILHQREVLGRFRSEDDLLSVPGIGPVLLGRLRPLVRF